MNHSLYNNQLQHQSAFYNPALANTIPQQQGSYAPNYNGNSNGFGFAGASGSFGPGGYHQSASIYPANPVKFLIKFIFNSIKINFFFLFI